MKNTVLCFGEALIDFHAQAPADPRELPAFVPHAGGAPANVAVAVARLGGDSAFIGMLGRDLFGDMLLTRMGEVGVAVDFIRRTDKANTALAFVSHDADGERSFSFYRPPSADLLFRESDFDPAIFSSGNIFHAGSCSMTEPAAAATTLHGMRRARDAGALVSFDVNLRPALWPRDEDPSPTIWQALALADFIKLSAEELAFLVASAGGEPDFFERLWRHHAKLVIVTDGVRPIRWFTREHHGEAPVFRVHAVDATGAGDAFTGGCLYQFAGSGIGAATLSGFVADIARFDSLLRFAAACGALAVTRTGSFAAMPTLAEVHAFLEAHA